MNRASPRRRTSGAWPTIALALTAIASFSCAGSDGVLTWNLAELTRAMHLRDDAVRQYFTDGRRVSFILERRIAAEVLHGKPAASEGAPYDVIDDRDGHWEVRSLSRHGVYFCPSNMVGSSRHFDERGFLQTLAGIRGYVVADIETFPEVAYWRVSSDRVLKWWRSGELGTDSKVSREKALAMLEQREPVRGIH